MSTVLPQTVMKLVSMKDSEGKLSKKASLVYGKELVCLSTLNDRLNLGFDEIASVIEANWRNL